MFGIGSTELLVILVVALIVLGPKSLAGLSRTLGKAVGEFRRVSTDFQRTLNAEAAQEEMKEAELKRKEAAEKGAASQKAPETPNPFAASEKNCSTDRAEKTDTPEDAASARGAEFAEQMHRVGNWEKQENGIPKPPAGSQLEEALTKAREEANSYTIHKEGATAETSKPAADAKQNA